ncbi:hypothetical protein BD779DRAFT_1476649 [Infundibulicybe gibba]|nr:hypothetical protein BD779DRAFT_1476649 [Infundibulicybe gibba]
MLPISGSTPQSEFIFEETWGAFVTLVYISTVLSGFIAMQACTYFHKFFHRDHYVLKYTVACIGWLSPSDSRFHSQQGWSSALLYRFDHNRYLLACCCVLAGIELGTGLAWMVRVARSVLAWQDAVLNESKWLIGISFPANVLLDTSIAASTCYQLWRSRMMGLKRLDSRTLDGVSSVVSLTIVLTTSGWEYSLFFLIVSVFILISGLEAVLTSRVAGYATGLLALLNARTSLDELDTDNLSLPTASLVWMRTSRSIGTPATRSAVTGGTHVDAIHDSHGVISKCDVGKAERLGKAERQLELVREDEKG